MEIWQWNEQSRYSQRKAEVEGVSGTIQSLTFTHQLVSQRFRKEKRMQTRMIRKALSRQGIHKNHVEAEALPKAKEQV